MEAQNSKDAKYDIPLDEGIFFPRGKAQTRLVPPLLCLNLQAGE